MEYPPPQQPRALRYLIISSSDLAHSGVEPELYSGWWNRPIQRPESHSGLEKYQEAAPFRRRSRMYAVPLRHRLLRKWGNVPSSRGARVGVVFDYPELWRVLVEGDGLVTFTSLGLPRGVLLKPAPLPPTSGQRQASRPGKHRDAFTTVLDEGQHSRAEG